MLKTVLTNRLLRLLFVETKCKCIYLLEAGGIVDLRAQVCQLTLQRLRGSSTAGADKAAISQHEGVSATAQGSKVVDGGFDTRQVTQSREQKTQTPTPPTVPHTQQAQIHDRIEANGR